jgi:hypothetical protein
VPGISYDGGYADYMVAPIEAIASIPDELSFTEAAPLMCAGITRYNALRNSGARVGDVVAILGIGGLGHLGIQFASKMGFKTIAISRGKDKTSIFDSSFIWRVGWIMHEKYGSSGVSQTGHQKILGFYIYYYDSSHHSSHYTLFRCYGICYNVGPRSFFGFWLSCLSPLYLTTLPYRKDSNQYRPHTFALVAFALNNSDIAYLNIYRLFYYCVKRTCFI